MPNIVIDVAAEFTGKKAFDKAGKATTTLERNVKSLASAFGLAFSTKAIVNFGKASVKAFADDDRAITVLRTNLKNLGLAYQATNAESFIAKLEQQSAILDDQLRPAYAQLSKVTLSTTKTQELMALAVDLARANGLEFTQVINTLSRAYVGNYKGLKQLNIGLSDAELKTKSFAEIQEILIKQSKGAGKAYIDTFAGSIDKLSVASANAKEIIGEGLVDLFADMAGNGDIEKATDNVITLATAVSDFLKDVDKYTPLDYIAAALTGSITQETFDKLNKRPSARRFFTGGSGKSDAQLELERRAREEKAAKAAAAAKIKADKLAAANKLKLEKAASVFDLTKISIAAALKGKISEEERTRLLLMQAIEDENAKKAEELQKKLEEIQKKNKEIADQLVYIQGASNPFDAWVTSLGEAVIILGKMPDLLNATGSLTSRGKKVLPTGDGLPTDNGSIFTPDMTPAEIADTATAAADLAIAAAEAAVADILASEPVIAAIADAATAATNIADIPTNDPYAGIGGSTGSSSMFNPYGRTPGSSAGVGIPYPSTNVYVTNTGSVIMQDEFVKAVADAVVVANTNGQNNYRPGAVID